ncbi:MAG: spermidine/putrescine ABC transporter substrate-binding protein [Candidatus Adiutrix sp.]|nr:spermidine/putrescine ABC transporter substrate-binding protein [Candidatus Adiutrix sp.]
MLIALGLIAPLAASAEATEELRILSGANITPPSVVERFELENNIHLRFDFFDSPEAMGAYIKTKHRGDLALLRGHYVGKLIQNHLLLPLNHALLPNLKNLEQTRSGSIDPGNLYSIPYLKGTLGIIYRRDVLGAEKPTWRQLFSQGRGAGSLAITRRRNTLGADKTAGADRQSHSAIPFAITDRYRDAMGLAQSYLGYSYNSTSPLAISQAAELLRVLAEKPTFMGFLSPETTLKYLKEKFIYAAVSYNYLAAVAMAQDPGLDYTVPAQNGMVWSYVYVVSAKTAKADAAYKWLNFLMEPEVAAEVAAWNRAASPNEAARPLLPQEIRGNQVIYPPDEVWGAAEMPLSIDDEAEHMSIDYWSHLK